ncbi:Modification methylase PaeR7I [Clostridium thermopalmarium DSM 5974]|uniref:site-specific DNA-methyltransferase (adenine-specific) n=3 Tax=Clostridiaceae TaxID=31979 RepID=A0A151AR84_9CLOT|nr:modification methylase PaeR7I [Clostridium colicanis DSM 13634]PRR75444.1 Modification methylase PaeR7I [Clostridium thermopalmarium DSM 5974]PVZ24346.1 adenine-specific DNA-methyltransferase [Clostridium thermopalmarium DSM 5974]
MLKLYFITGLIVIGEMKMLELFLKEIDELYNIINAPIDYVFKIMAIEKQKKVFNIWDDNFSTMYIKLIEKERGKAEGVVYTPKEIADYMAREVILKEDLINNPFIKVIDPSCGCGDILLSCYRRLNYLYENNLEEINKRNNIMLTKEDIPKHIIDNNLFGIDIDGKALKILAVDLFSISGHYNSSNFKNLDFLIDDIEEKYDIIIGNPPYVGHKSIDKDYSKKLKRKFKEIYKDKGDISYCFFKEALNRLNKKGRLSFITSRYFIEAPSGEELRKVLKEVCSLYKIVDFYGIRPFKKVGIDPVIIFLINEQEREENIEIIKPIDSRRKNKDKFYESLFLNEGNYYKRFFINKNLLNNKGWILRDKKERDIISKIEERSFTNLYNICESYQGIITGCDKAFIVDKKTIDEEDLEKDIIKPWIKSSYINRGNVDKQDTYLIYSDLIENPQEYENVMKHIGRLKHKLMERRECKRGVRKWYELQWGRKREIFDGEKIIFPYKSSSNRFALDKGNYFSADVYALVLRENVPFTYKYLISLLNSKVYQFYFQSFAKKLGDDLYEYYPNNLLKLCIPTMGEKECLEEEDLHIIFNLSEEEINIIEEYTR